MKIFYSRKGASHLEALQQKDRLRIGSKMCFFAAQNDPLVFAKYITIRGLYRFRVGGYRIFFKIVNNEIFVTTVERRDKAYG